MNINVKSWFWKFVSDFDTQGEIITLGTKGETDLRGLWKTAFSKLLCDFEQKTDRLQSGMQLRRPMTLRKGCLINESTTQTILHNGEIIFMNIAFFIIFLWFYKLSYLVHKIYQPFPKVQILISLNHFLHWSGLVFFSTNAS